MSLHNLVEAEQSVLGAVMLDNAVMDDVVPFLEARDFTPGAHRMIWEGMLHLYRNDKPIDIVLMAEMIGQAKRADEISAGYLAELVNAVPTAKNAKHYAKIVRSAGLKRRGIEAGQQITELSESGEFESDEEYFGVVEKIASELRPNDTSRVQKIGDFREKYMQFLRTKEDLILTSFRNFDNWLGGVGRGWLCILAARPSTGKTAKMLQTAQGIAQQNVGQVVVFSLEMAKEQLVNRMMAAQAHLNGNRIRRKELDEQDFTKVHNAFDTYFDDLPLHIDDYETVTMDYIKATVRQIRRQHGPIAAIFVDYLQLMKIDLQKGQSRSSAIGEVTRSAKLFAKEMNCPFFMLSQLNRDVEKRNVAKPMLSDLRESGDIEQDADIVEFLWINPEDKDNRGTVVQSFIAKGRDVGVNDFRYLFKPWYQSYEELTLT